MKNNNYKSNPELPEGDLTSLVDQSYEKQTQWSNDKTIILTGLSQSIVICQCLADHLFASAFGFGK